MTSRDLARGRMAARPSPFAVLRRKSTSAATKVHGLALLAGVALAALASSAAVAQNVHVLDGETFDVTVNPTVIQTLNIDPGGTVELNGNFLVVQDNGVDTTWSGTVHGTINVAQLIKLGTGTVHLSNLTMDGGELHLNKGGAVQTDGTNNIRYLTVGSDAGEGFFDISGGTLNILGALCPCSPAMQVGDFGGIGVVNQTGGTVNFGPTNPAFNIGNQGGNGTYNLSGGSIMFGPGGIMTIGRSNNALRNSTGLLNISGGLLEVDGSDLVIGNNNPGGGPLTTGTVTQTGGTMRFLSTADLFLQGYNHGTYNLLGGVLEIGGGSLHGEPYTGFGANVTGSYEFNFGDGTIKVIGSALVTNADAMLIGAQTGTIDTNGLGATWNGDLSGEGGLRKTGAGTLTLAGINTYTGLTTVELGTLFLTAPSLLDMSSGVDLAGAGATFDISTGSKQIKDLSGVGGSIVELGASTLTAGTSNDTEFAGVIQGTGGLTKVGGGVLSLSGMSTYTGLTTISQGTLRTIVSNAITDTSGVTLANQTRWDLAGAGAQHVSGFVTMTGASILEVTLGNGHDNVDADGPVALSGILDIHGGNGNFDPSAPYTVISGSGLGGAFGGFYSDLAFLTPTIGYDGTSAFLTFAKSGQTFAFVSETPNQAAVGGALDMLPLGNSLLDQVITLSVPDALMVLDSLSGDFHPSTTTALIEQGEYIGEAVGDRIRQALFAGGAGGGGADATMPAPSPDHAAHGAGAWMQAFGHMVDINDDTDNAGDLAGHDIGVLGGIDAGSGAWLAGVGGGYSNSSLSSEERSSEADVQSLHAVGYVAGDAGPVRIQGGAAYSWSTIDSTRTVDLPMPQTLTASYGARTTQVFGEVSAELGPARPFLGANYISVATDGFTETGGDAALSADAAVRSVTFTTLGVRAEAAANSAVMHGMIGWRHAFGDLTSLSTFEIQGQGFTATGVPIAANALVAEAGIDMRVSPQVTVGVAYTGQIATGAQEHGAKGTASIEF